MKNKLIVSVVGAVIVGIAVGYYFASSVSAMIREERIKAQDNLLKAQTEQAISMLEGINDKVQIGELRAEYAKGLAADLLRSLRYGDDQSGYFFVDTFDGVNVVLYGNKDIEGKNRYEDEINGVKYVQAIIGKAMAGGGYTDYWYPKMGGDEPIKKRAYSVYFEPFEWSVGTGYYIEDIK